VGTWARIGQAMGVYVTIPSTPGDVAQVEDLPPGVAEAFGINSDSEKVPRRQAFTIPAFRKGVAKIAGLICQFPLEAHRVAAGEDGRAAPALPDITLVRRSVLEQPDPNISASKWVANVVVDLICEPAAWCLITRRDAARFPLQLQHLDYRWLRITRDKIFYLDVELPLRDIVRFDTPVHQDGALRDGASVLRTALEIEATVRRYAKNPMPLGVLSDPSAATVGGRDKISDTTVQKILDKWELGALKRVVRWIGRLKFDAVQFNPEQLQLNKSAERSDTKIAQLLWLTPDDVNAPATGSDTYRNIEAEAADKINTIRPYMLAITQRLSMPDITPRGQVVKFSTTAYVRGTTAEVIGAAVNATSGDRPLMGRDEARARFLDLPPMTEEAEEVVEDAAA
jgi:hypothetical protein